jgi:hypothetical protein
MNETAEAPRANIESLEEADAMSFQRRIPPVPEEIENGLTRSNFGSKKGNVRSPRRVPDE